MEVRFLKVRSSPTTVKRQETEGFATPLHFLLTVSILSYRALSRGSMKPNFIYNEKRKFKKPPLLKRYK